MAADLKERWGRVDGVLHAIAFAPEDALGGNFLNTPPESAIIAFQTSAFSLKALAVGLAGPVSRRRAPRSSGSTSTRSVAWPVYDWMGVAKAALEATSRYLARDLGPRKVRVNLVSRRPARHAGRARHPGLLRPRRRLAAPGAAGLGRRGPGARWPRRSTSCSPTPRGRSPRRSSTSTAASTRWARRSCRSARRGRGVKPPVFLTGATGFLGMEVIARLLERGDREVLALVRAAGPGRGAGAPGRRAGQAVARPVAVPRARPRRRRAS